MTNPSHHARRPSRRASRALALALFALLALPLVARAEAPSQQELDRRERRAGLEISDVENRLRELQSRIEGEQQAVMELQVQIAEAARGLASAQRGFDETVVRVLTLEHQLDQAEAEQQEIQDRLGERAVAAVELSDGSALEFVLDAGSLTEMGDRLEFLNQLQVADEALAEQARLVAGSLEEARDAHDEELARQARLVRLLDTEEEALHAALTDQQWRLNAINEARAEARRLLSELNDRVERIAEQRFAVPSSGGATFGAWAKSFLQHLGAPVCSDNIVILVTWQVSEYTEARWNPLATTLDMPGDTIFNSHGVRNYASLQQGLEATEQTLINGASTYGYGPILQRLKSCADRMDTAEAIRASSWCAGCASGAYVTGLVPIVERYWERYVSASAWD